MLAALLGGCQPAATDKPRPTVALEVPDKSSWRGVASAEDISRIDRLPAAWSEALADARKAGFSRQIREEGDLLKADGSLPRAAPPPGSYNCRLIKLGSAAPRERAFISHKPFFCFVGVSDNQLSITKQTGSLRPGGYLWDTEDSARLIFLGSIALGSEDVPLPYGENSARDMAGVFERFGNFRYRLLVPWPRQGSKLDVFELIPVPEQP
jgi:hypothetical protein